MEGGEGGGGRGSGGEAGERRGKGEGSRGKGGHLTLLCTRCRCSRRQLAGCMYTCILRYLPEAALTYVPTTLHPALDDTSVFPIYAPPAGRKRD